MFRIKYIISKSNVIISIFHPGIPAYITYMTGWDLYYPDMGSVNIINTPRIFENLLQVVRSALSEKRNQSFKVYGTNKIEWTEALHGIIEPEQLQRAFGGSKTA